MKVITSTFAAIAPYINASNLSELGNEDYKITEYYIIVGSSLYQKILARNLLIIYPFIVLEDHRESSQPWSPYHT